MERVAVTSTAISSVGYDSEAFLLEVELKSGKVYEYYAVPEKVYQEFMAPPDGSMGRYYTAWIRSRYPYRLVSEEEDNKP